MPPRRLWFLIAQPPLNHRSTANSPAPANTQQVFAVFLAGCITLALSLFGLTVLAWA